MKTEERSVEKEGIEEVSERREERVREDGRV
jgi:hypothetical protein